LPKDELLTQTFAAKHPERILRALRYEVEWVLRPYFNRQKEALALPEDSFSAKDAN